MMCMRKARAFSQSKGKAKVLTTSACRELQIAARAGSATLLSFYLSEAKPEGESKGNAHEPTGYL